MSKKNKIIGLVMISAMMVVLLSVISIASENKKHTNTVQGNKYNGIVRTRALTNTELYTTTGKETSCQGCALTLKQDCMQPNDECGNCQDYGPHSTSQLTEPPTCRDNGNFYSGHDRWECIPPFVGVNDRECDPGEMECYAWRDCSPEAFRNEYKCDPSGEEPVECILSLEYNTHCRRCVWGNVIQVHPEEDSECIDPVP